ncbi:MAG: DUF6249 domain-containing protein [Saonia sp.]
MNSLIIVFAVLCIVVLIVSIIYISNTHRHKERIALLESNQDPKLFDSPQSRLAPLKWGMLLMGAGLGFLTAFLLDNYMFSSIADTEPIYPAMVFLFGGTGLVVYYKLFGQK